LAAFTRVSGGSASSSMTIGITKCPIPCCRSSQSSRPIATRKGNGKVSE
jgi:hypothetical protein